MAQAGYTPISLYHSTTTTNVPTNTNLVNGELAINITDGKLFYKDNVGTVQLLASKAGASGDVVGPASATDNAVVRFDGTTGKLVQNSGVLIADDGTTVISVNSATDALRITQTGAGNALVVEDSANPDSTPFVINNAGQTQVACSLPTGSTSNLTVGNRLDISDTSNNTDVITLDWSSNLARIRVTSWSGTFRDLAFQTGGAERMRINTNGNVGIGSTPTADGKLRISGTYASSSNTSTGIYLDGTIPSTSTTSTNLVYTAANTEAASFTVSDLRHFLAAQGTIGVGSTVTNQYGFVVGSNVTGATNNYGFFGNIASGSNRWNLYMNGTASNYLGGDTIINGKIGLGTAGSPSYGTAGQVLTSNGSGSAPTWQTAGGGGISTSQAYFFSSFN